MKEAEISRRDMLLAAPALVTGLTKGFPLSHPAKQPRHEVVHIPAGQGQKGRIARSDITFKLDKSHTAGNFGSTELTIPPGQLGAPPHVHQTL